MELADLRIADPAERWQGLGFAVEGATMPLGGVEIELGADGQGIVGWTLRHAEVSGGDVDGLPTQIADGRPGSVTKPHRGWPSSR